MKGIYYTAVCILLMAAHQACNQVSPEKYIAVTALNSNLVSTAYRPMFFTELIALKGDGRLTGSAKEYVMERAVKPVQKAIGKVNGLRKTDDAKELIATAKEVMEYGQQIFETDYLAIAQLIDTGKPEEEIHAAIAKMYEDTEETLFQKFDKLDQLAIAYAKKHNISFSVR